MHDRSRGYGGLDGANALASTYSQFRVGDRDDDTPADPGGFTGTCNTTLIDWIQLVQMGRRDAVLGVRTYDGQEGTLWCHEGDIIDAECDGAVGEEAVYRTLAWKSGRVSVDFVAEVAHARHILTPTAGLLLESAYRRDSGMHQIADLQVRPIPGTPATSFDVARDVTEVSAPSELPVIEDHELDDIQLRGRFFSLRFVLAGSISVVFLFLTAGLGWRWFGSAPAAAGDEMFPPVATPRAAPPAPRIANPPPRRVVTRPFVAPPSPERAPEPAPSVRRVIAASSPPKGPPARHHAPIALSRRSGASFDTPIFDALSAARVPLPAKSKVQIIDEPAHAAPPQVQIVGDAPKRAQPRIQIIEERKPHIQTVE